MTDKPPTATQTNLLTIIRHQFGTKAARGLVPQGAIDCYDQRSFRGLLQRNLIVAMADSDGDVRYKLAEVRTR